MIIHRYTSAFLCLFLFGATQGYALQQCSEEQATIQATSTQEIPHEAVNCQSQPYLEVKLFYTCTRCGQPNGSEKVMTANAQGHCSAGLTCNGKFITDRPGTYSNEWVLVLEKSRVYMGPSGFSCGPDGRIYPKAACTCPSTQECGIGSPIVVSLNDHQIELTDAACGVDFDLNRDGIAEHLSWTKEMSDEGFLFLDRNENGTVDDGGELFGDYSPQPESDERNGFKALAMFDDPFNGGNGDGVISREDRIFEDLQLWVDYSHDGYSDAGEIYYLEELGIDSIDLDYREAGRVDKHGNELRYWSFARGEADPGAEPRKMWDVFFVIGTSGSPGPFQGDCTG